MNRVIVFVLVVCVYSSLFGQEAKNNIVFGEAIGSTRIYSLNYERVLTKHETVNVTARIGFSYFPRPWFNEVQFPIPLSSSLIYRIYNDHWLEFRLFVTNYFTYDYYSIDGGYGGSKEIKSDDKRLDLILEGGYAIGYRFHPIQDKYFFNILYQRMEPLNKENWYFNIGLGIGYTF